MAKKKQNLTDLLNEATFSTIYNKFMLLAVNAFEWDGLPEGILPRHIESTLFKNGKACFFKAKNMGLMCLPCANGGRVNVYGDPLSYRAYGFGFNEMVDADKCVIIENNSLRLSTHDFLMVYANKIAEAERTMDVNVKANKTPIVMLCDSKDVMSFKQIFHKVDGNVPAIFADKALNMDSIQALDTKVKFLCNELMDYKHSVEAELLTFLGVNNPAVDKKERLITDEANSNNQLIASFMEMQLKAREKAVEEINAMFGCHISVKRRESDMESEVIENVEEPAD